MKSKSKRIVSYIIAAVMAVSGMALIGPADAAYAAYAAAKPKLSKKKVTLQTGKTTKVTLKYARKKVTWTSSNKKIVTIKKKTGKRKQTAVLKAGKKTGTCYVRAKIGKKVWKCRVTVKAKPKKIRPVKPTNPTNPAQTPEREIEILPLSGDLEDLSAGCTYKPAAVANVSEDFAKAAAAFSVKLLQETMKAELAQDVNILISPDSVMTALTMTENGAAGSTLAGMHNVLTGGLQIEGLDTETYNTNLSAFHNRLEKLGKPLYTSANSIWVRKDVMALAPAFAEKNKKLHNAVTYQAPFDDQTIADMNNWVYNNTRNMIRDIIDGLDPQTRVVLINTTAFEGKWAEPFQEGQVRTGSFTTSDGAVQSVNMLEETLRGMGCYLEIKGAKAFCKPYEISQSSGGKSIGFVGILPATGDVDAYVQGLSGQDFVSAWNSAQNKTVRLRIPEFKYDYSTSMKKVLTNMGMGEAFTDAADFSAMSASGNKEVFIDEVLHKTHIELDRNGTSAAAATAVIAKAGAAPSQEIVEIFLDRPFVFALVDMQTGIPLFLGVVKNVNTGSSQ